MAPKKTTAHEEIRKKKVKGNNQRDETLKKNVKGKKNLLEASNYMEKKRVKTTRTLKKPRNESTKMWNKKQSRTNEDEKKGADGE